MPSFSRRNFATSLGASIILAPFLRLGGGSASAAGPKKAKRLLLFCTMGTHPDKWRPTSVTAENSFTFSDMTAPLAAVKQNVVLVDGLVSANPGDNHASPDGLTGLGFGSIGNPALISIDQFIGDRLAAAGVNTPISTFLLGARSNAGGGKTMFNRTTNLPTISSPLGAYSAAFGVTNAPGASAVDLLKRRKSALDLIVGEINSLEQRVGASEKAKLDVHLESLRQVETRLSQSMATSSAPNVCSKPPEPSDDTSNILTANLLHMDVIVSAFACDITRVAAIEFGSDTSLQVNLPDVGLQGDEHGGFIHSGAPDFKNLIKMEQWFSQRFVDLMTKLQAIPEADGSGSLFDNTLMAWCRDMGDAVNHNQKDMKYVLAGGAGGYLATDPNGRYLHNDGQSPGSRHERLLLSLADAMGVTTFTGFGDSKLTGANKTPLPGIAA